MQRESNSEITFLVEDLEAILEMNKLLEKENQELKHEVVRLKSQIASLKAHDLERKSTLWKKIQYNQPCNANKDDEVIIHQKNPAVEKPDQSGPPQNSSTISLISPKKNGNNDPVGKGVQVQVQPPPPPPLPSKSMTGSKLAVRRMPEVVEFYRYLSKKNSQLMENRANVPGILAQGNDPRNMIGEIENRSTYLSAVKSDVEKQREFINFLSREVETAAFKEISAIEPFVKWLDEELSCLVDERAVLKHFPHWPERKLDALREASGSFQNLKNLECEVMSFKDNPKLPLAQSLRRILALQDRLERVTNDIERTREGACKRYKEFQIPWDWMQDTALLGQIKLSSLRLAREHMKRVIKELENSKSSKQTEDIMLEAARFAYRVHQFAGGYDLDTKHLFEQLKRIHSTNPL